MAAIGKFKDRPYYDPVAPAAKLLSILLWDLRRPDTPPLILKGSDASSSTVAFSPDATRLASWGRDKDKVFLWDLRQPDAPPQILRGNTVDVTSLAFSPDGTRLASSGVVDNPFMDENESETIQLWDLRQPNAPPQIIKGLGDYAHSLIFAADSMHLVMGARRAISGFGTRIGPIRRP